MLLRALILAGLMAAAAAPATFAAQASEAPAAAPASRSASGVGVITQIDARGAVLTVKHEPISALGWPAMTMPFHLASPAMLKGLKVGQKIAFDAKEAQGLPEITAIRKP